MILIEMHSNKVGRVFTLYSSSPHIVPITLFFQFSKFFGLISDNKFAGSDVVK